MPGIFRESRDAVNRCFPERAGGGAGAWHRLGGMTDALHDDADGRRLRFVVSGASDGFAEAAWTGRTARLGGATLRFVAGCPRCVMITRPFAELPEDRSIMRTLVRETAQVLGMYTAVDEPGDVRLGDELVLD